MFGAELVIVLLAIYHGARLGGIGIGFAGGLGPLRLMHHHYVLITYLRNNRVHHQRR